MLSGVTVTFESVDEIQYWMLLKSGTRNREPETENREQGTGNREQGTGNREQGTGNREQETGNREQGTGNRAQGTGVWERAVSSIPHKNSKWRMRKLSRGKKNRLRTTEIAKYTVNLS